MFAMAVRTIFHGREARLEPRLGAATAPVRVELGRARPALWLALATLAVVGACVVVSSLSILLGRPSLFGLARLFDLNQEFNIPSLYSGLLLLGAAVLLFVVATIERRRRNLLWRHWAILAAGFVYLTFDELVGIHEKLNRPLQDLLGLSGDVTTWVIAGGLAALVAGAFFLPFLRLLPRRHAATFLAAGILFVGSAVGMEIVSTNWVGGMTYADNGAYDWVGLAKVALEETGEMAGVVLFIHALLDYLRQLGGRLELLF
jgi:hypothetical protein